MSNLQFEDFFTFKPCKVADLETYPTMHHQTNKVSQQYQKDVHPDLVVISYIHFTIMPNNESGATNISHFEFTNLVGNNYNDKIIELTNKSSRYIKIMFY